MKFWISLSLHGKTVHGHQDTPELREQGVCLP